ncbi:MAG: hypothetical protein ACXWWX_04870 [Actinomycetota bacterium]
MRRTLMVLAIVVTACASEPDVEGAPGLVGSPPPALPASALPTMTVTGETASIDVEAVAAESTHPDDLQGLLEESGFTGGVQRSFGGGRGAFARVLSRGLAFTDEEGAAAYLDWFEEYGGVELINAEPIAPASLPAGVVAFRHLPDGCCHNDVPVFLAAWRRGSSVLYVSGAGRRANAAAFVELVRVYDEET